MPKRPISHHPRPATPQPRRHSMPRRPGKVSIEVEKELSLSKEQEAMEPIPLVWKFGKHTFKKCFKCHKKAWHVDVEFFPCDVCGGWHRGFTCTLCAALGVFLPRECLDGKLKYHVQAAMAQLVHLNELPPRPKCRR